MGHIFAKYAFGHGPRSTPDARFENLYGIQ